MADLSEVLAWYKRHRFLEPSKERRTDGRACLNPALNFLAEAIFGFFSNTINHNYHFLSHTLRLLQMRPQRRLSSDRDDAALRSRPTGGVGLHEIDWWSRNPTHRHWTGAKADPQIERWTEPPHNANGRRPAKPRYCTVLAIARMDIPAVGYIHRCTTSGRLTAADCALSGPYLFGAGGRAWVTWPASWQIATVLLSAGTWR